MAFITEEELRTQMKQALGEMIITSKNKCNMCDKVCSDEEDLDWHLRKHHSRKSESVHSCNLCDYIITGENSLERSIKSSLDQHMKKQHTHWCRECSTTFMSHGTGNQNNSWSWYWKSKQLRTQWVHHMKEEHRMRELRLLSSEKYTVVQWTFLHPTDKLLFYQQMALNDGPNDVTTSEDDTTKGGQ